MKSILNHLVLFSILYTAIYAIYAYIFNQYLYSDITLASIIWLVKSKIKSYCKISITLYGIFMESSFTLIYIIIVLVITYIIKNRSNNYKKKTESKENILYRENPKKKIYQNLNQDQFIYKIFSIFDDIKRKGIYNRQLLNDTDSSFSKMFSNKYNFENFDIEKNNNIEVYRYLNVITDFESVYSFSTIKNGENDEKNKNINENNFSLPKLRNTIIDLNQIKEHLKTMMDWNFDNFKLSDLSNYQPILYLGKEIFEQHNFQKHFNLKLSTIESFLTTMENQYHVDLPYHNNIHAADVLHAMNYFISQPILDNSLTIEEKFACIVSAIIHDIDHPGVSNSYEIKYSEPLSKTYNSKSVLENHHCSLAFKIFRECSECNILKNLSKIQYNYIRSLIINMVLATDMAYHKSYLDEFTEKLNNKTFNINNSKDRKLLLCILIKCADISNPTKINNIAIQWSNRLFEEDQIQSVNELKQNNYTLSPLIKQDCISKSENQTSFIRTFVKPIFEQLGSFLDVDNFIALKQLEENDTFWENYKE
jgi:hypothetical protein